MALHTTRIASMSPTRHVFAPAIPPSRISPRLSPRGEVPGGVYAVAAHVTAAAVRPVETTVYSATVQQKPAASVQQKPAASPPTMYRSVLPWAGSFQQSVQQPSVATPRTPPLLPTLSMQPLLQPKQPQQSKLAPNPPSSQGDLQNAAKLVSRRAPPVDSPSRATVISRGENAIGRGSSAGSPSAQTSVNGCFASNSAAFASATALSTGGTFTTCSAGVSAVVSAAASSSASTSANMDQRSRGFGDLRKFEQQASDSEQRDNDLQNAILQLTSQVATLQKQQSLMVEQMAAARVTHPAAKYDEQPGVVLVQNASSPGTTASPDTAAEGFYESGLGFPADSPKVSTRTVETNRNVSKVSWTPIPRSPPPTCRIMECDTTFGPADFSRVPDFGRDEQARMRDPDAFEQQQRELLDVQARCTRLQSEKANLEETLKGTLVRTATVEADNAELREFVGSLVTRIATLEGQPDTNAEAPFARSPRQQGVLLPGDAAHFSAQISAAARGATPQCQSHPVPVPSGGRGRGRPAQERPPLANR